MPRVIAGTARGRQLLAPTGDGTRPTADRAREALFSTLTSEVGDLTGLRVADLYAGSGAVGLEALSRGAAHVLLVERDPGAATAIRTNIRTVGLPGAELVVASVAKVVETPPSHPYDVVFLDPPYVTKTSAVLGLLAALVDNAWLADEAVVAVERAAREHLRQGSAWVWPEGLEPLRDKRYGEAMLCYGRAAQPS